MRSATALAHVLVVEDAEDGRARLLLLLDHVDHDGAVAASSEAVGSSSSRIGSR